VAEFKDVDGLTYDITVHQRLKFRKRRKQGAQLMLTNLRDAFMGQSRSPNIVPFHMLDIVSYCAIVTLSLRRAIFTIFDLKKCRDLEILVRGHSWLLKVAPFGRLCMVSY